MLVQDVPKLRMMSDGGNKWESSIKSSINKFHPSKSLGVQMRETSDANVL